MGYSILNKQYLVHGGLAVGGGGVTAKQNQNKNELTSRANRAKIVLTFIYATI